MGRIALCCFGEGCVSSDHMQIATAHTELLLRIRNKPRKIPLPHELQHFLLSATVLAVELTIQHRSVGQVSDISMEFSFPLHTRRECRSLSALTLMLFAPLIPSVFAPYTWAHPVFFQPLTWKPWARDEVLSSNCLENQGAWILTWILFSAPETLTCCFPDLSCNYVSLYLGFWGLHSLNWWSTNIDQGRGCPSPGWSEPT